MHFVRLTLTLPLPLALTVALIAAQLAACIDEGPDEDAPPAARIVATWDPLACSDEQHRVVIELEDEDGAEIAASALCRIGGLTLEAPRWGLYHGRIYTWVLGEPIRSITPVLLVIDAPVVHWQLTTPS